MKDGEETDGIIEKEKESEYEARQACEKCRTQIEIMEVF